MDDSISRQWLMECVNEGWIKFDTEKDENRFIHLVRDIAPSAKPEQKGYTKAEYIMALHKEYGVDFARAEEAHNRALEYLRSTAMMKG